MKDLLKTVIVLSLLVMLTGCISYEQITEPKIGSDQSKTERFEYMESHWSYLNNRWIVAETVMPADLVHAYGIPYDQAKSEIDEFVEMEHSYSWFHRFVISLYLNPIRFYVK